MSEWREVKLYELAEVKGGKRLPKGKLLTTSKTNHPYIRITDFDGFKINLNNIQYVADDVQPSIARYIVNSGDIILSNVGTLGLSAIVPSELDNANLTENCVKIILNKDEVDNKFLYYQLISPEMQDLIIGLDVGSTQPKLPMYNIKNMGIVLPPLQEQKAIAEVLSSLDDKIDLLHRQNKTLEALAQTLFRQWFVEEAKDEWEEKPLKEVTKIAIGRTPPRKEFHWFSKDSKDVKWVSIKDMGEDGAFTFETSEYLTKEAVQTFNVPVIPPDTVLLSFKMTLGRIKITTEPMLSNEAIAHFKFNEKTPFNKEYLYLYLKTYPYQTLGSTSSIVTSINSTMIKEMLIPIPDKKIIDDFTKIVESQFNKIFSNQKQIKSLENMRDTLLPKLMSGGVRVER